MEMGEKAPGTLFQGSVEMDVDQDGEPCSPIEMAPAPLKKSEDRQAKRRLFDVYIW